MPTTYNAKTYRHAVMNGTEAERLAAKAWMRDQLAAQANHPADFDLLALVGEG